MSVHSSQQQHWNGALPQMGAHAEVTCCSAGDGRVSLLVEMDGYSSSNSPPFAVTRQCLTIAQVTPLTSAASQAPSRNLAAVTMSSVMHIGQAVCSARLVCRGSAHCSVRVRMRTLLVATSGDEHCFWGTCCNYCYEALLVRRTPFQKSLNT